jgi:integrase
MEVMPMTGIGNLRETYPVLLSRMKADGYAGSYVARVRRAVEWIVRGWDVEGWDGYVDVYACCEAKSASASYLREMRGLIRLIEQFDVYGRFPDGGRHCGLFIDSAYNRLLPVFKDVVDCYRNVVLGGGRPESGVKVESSSGSTFFEALQAQGVTSLGGVTEKAVLSVFTATGDSSGKSCTYKKNVAVVLKAASSVFPELSVIVGFLPDLHGVRRNIQYLDDGEIQRVKDVLRGEGGLSLRDRAIGTLAVHTGLRSCDIAAMTTEAIDWAADLIRLVQAKTGVGLVLPLSAVVGNAVYDYLTRERPVTDCPYLFISKTRPYGRLQAGSMHNIAVRIMGAAGIRTRPGDRRGLHLFRHRLATALLGNEVPAPVVSRTLGHASPVSLDAYLSADLTHLRQCSISIELFPVAAGVFQHG